jgi:hypothetical protein
MIRKWAHRISRRLKHGFWSSPIEALQSNSSSKEGEGKKRRLHARLFLQSEPSPYFCLALISKKKSDKNPKKSKKKSKKSEKNQKNHFWI